MRLIMLSGGLDSVAALIKEVETNGADNLSALHISFGNNPRNIPELFAAESICEMYEVPLYVQKVDCVPVADFDFLAMFAFSFAYRIHNVNEIIWGFTGNGSGKHYSELFQWANSYQEHLKSYDTGEPYEIASLTTPIDGLSRNELSNIVKGNFYWSCRNPIINASQFEPCMSCGTCREFLSEGIPHNTIGIDFNHALTSKLIYRNKA